MGLRHRIHRAFVILRKLRIRSHHVKRATLVTAILIALALLFAVGVVVRFWWGPVPIGPFADRLHAALNNALPGVAVTYEDAALEWSPDEGRVNLVILGARVFDSQQHIIAQAPKAEIGLAAMALLRGKVEIQRIDLVGVQLTLVRDKEGVLHLGVERNQSQGDVLQRIRDAISKSGNGPSTLERFAVSKARVAFYDETSGLFLVAPQADVAVSNDSRNVRPEVVASVDANVEITGQPAHVVGRIFLPKNGAVSGDVDITGLQLKALAGNSKTFAFLTPFDLKVDISGSFAFGAGTKLRSADLAVGATGIVGGMGSPLKVKSFRFVGRYDGLTRRLLFDDASLEGENAKAHFQGVTNLSFAPDGSWSGADLDLTGEQITVGIPSAFQHSVTMGHIAVRGSYSAAQRTFTLARFGLDGPGVAGDFSGRLVLADNMSPEIAVSGQLREMSVRDLVRYWPVKIGEGARNWIAANVTQGQIGPLSLNMDVKSGGFGAVALSDNALSLTFPITKANVTYIHGMTPISNASGTGVLTGDTFKATIASGRVGPLVIGKGQVVIPNLHVPGTVADITVNLQGQLRDVLAQLDMKPLQYPTRFHLKPSDASGATTINANFQVPTIRNVDVGRIGISVKAAVSGFALPLGNEIKLTNGTVNFDVDNQHMHAVGNVSVGHTPVTADWTEIFNTTDDVTTRVTVRGNLDDETRNALHLGLEDILSGPVDAVATIEGHRGSVRRAHIAADLTRATVALDLINYRKAAGAAANAEIAARFDSKGSIAAADVAVSGAGLTAQGSLSFDSGNLARADFPLLRAGAANDFAMSLIRTGANATEIAVKGQSADGMGFGRRASSANAAATKPAQERAQLHVTGKLNRVVLRDGAVISPFTLDLTEIGDRVQTLTIAAGGKSDSVIATIAPAPDGRKLNVTAANAGALLKGIFGLADLSGGEMAVSATLPAIGAAPGKMPDYAGVLTIRDFKVENQPFFARLFSAGSLGGLVDLMQGQGIVIDRLAMPFSGKNDVIDIREAHASGPSIGLSAEGYLDRRSNQLDLRGAVAPVYGLNGMLNAIPLLGDVLTSKRGEGIFGVTYEASGSIDEPRISVNPLAMLTPGIFRRIFEGSAPIAPQVPAMPSVPQKPPTAPPH